MNSIEDIKTAAFLCAPYFLDKVGLVHCYSIKEILSLGQFEYNRALGLMTMTPMELEDQLKKKGAQLKGDVDVFDNYMESCKRDKHFLLELEQAFSTFIREEVVILPEMAQIIIGSDDLQRVITKSDFLSLQQVIRVQNHLDVEEDIPENENPMHRKFRLKRQMVALAKKKQARKEAEKNKENSVGFADMMSSIATADGYTPKEISEFSYYAVYDLFERLQARDKHKTDISALIAGADSKKIKVESWTKNLLNNL